MAMQLMARNLKDLQATPEDKPIQDLTLTKIRSTDFAPNLHGRSPMDQLGSSPPRILRQKTLFDKKYRSRFDSLKGELISEDDRSTILFP
eukprot:CAMPEP_0170511250 /NCGR_PEP_ID=MMETSP0208-20121228/66205_1 /TAXON_ID=197538 /ORGANISM="Strombidium inclinatum, Strain S3" /LENGTH=89 /DNA_ID=CAMNT_0010794779 /DNA_START=620 /DNA_END=889 /DNA_ORIENTATION=-